YTMGRAPSCRIVLKDDMCSREHAEVYRTGGHWRVRDLNSLNGTKVNGDRLVDNELDLSPHDEVALGHTRLLFVEDMARLPDLPALATDGIEIKKRLGQTRFLTPLPMDLTDKAETSADETPRADSRHTLSR